MVVIKNLYSKDDDIGLEELKVLINKITDSKKIKKRIYLYLIDNEEIKKLNKEFLKKNKYTNVLSFPSYEKTMLGEIFISVDYCKKESPTTGLSPLELIVFYFIHGLLHLTGYEHIKDEKEEKKMRKEELRLFKLVFPDMDLEDEA